MEVQITAGIIVSLFATAVFTRTPSADNERANAAEIHLGATTLTLVQI